MRKGEVLEGEPRSSNFLFLRKMMQRDEDSMENLCSINHTEVIECNKTMQLRNDRDISYVPTNLTLREQSNLILKEDGFKPSSELNTASLNENEEHDE